MGWIDAEAEVDADACLSPGIVVDGRVEKESGGGRVCGWPS